jgi:hypothetical protein
MADKQTPQNEEQEQPLIKPYNHKPYIIPPGKEVFELCLINGKIRKAEWHDVRPPKVRLKALKKLLAAMRLRKPLPVPKPIRQLVEYEDCIYIPAENMQVAKTLFDRALRMSDAKTTLKRVK